MKQAINNAADTFRAFLINTPNLLLASLPLAGVAIYAGLRIQDLMEKAGLFN